MMGKANQFSSAVAAIFSRIRRMHENRERNRNARELAIFVVGDAIRALADNLKIDNSPWDEAYLAEIWRVYRKAIPGHVRERLVTHEPATRGIYGVSLDGGPIIPLDRRVTEAEAKELAFKIADRLYFDGGKVVKEIRLHRRGLWFAGWTRHDVEAWTPRGWHELVGIDDETRSYTWKEAPRLPTLFSRSDGEYKQVGILDEEG